VELRAINQARAMNRFSISLDWLAVLLALAAVILVKLGVVEGVPW
jgi:hypothetical protein